MIDLGTLAGLHRHDHELHVYCGRCDRWAAIDLVSLVRAGQGGRRLPIPARCRRCGGSGQLQVRPPMPGHPAAHGWIRPGPSRAAGSA